MVGNGVTDAVFDGDALVPFAFGMGLISSDLLQVLLSRCTILKSIIKIKVNTIQ